MRLLGRLAIGVALAVTLIGTSVLSLLTPAFTQTLSSRFSEVQATGLPRARVLAIAEQVRLFVAEGRGTLPSAVDGRAGFDAAAVSHLRDVALVLANARIATLVFAAICLVWAFVLVMRRDLHEMAVGLRFGAAVSATLVVIAVGASLFSFDAVFTVFHGLFFKAGTWTFPDNSLLIQTFPETFWATAGASWAGLVLLGAALLALVSVPVDRSARGATASSAPRTNA